MNNYGELGEFYPGFCMPEELADPFYEDETRSEEKLPETKICGCTSHVES